MARACLDYVAGLAVQAAPAAAAAVKEHDDATRITAAEAARRLERSKNLPMLWVERGLVEGWDPIARTAPWGSWRAAQGKAPRRGRPRKST